MNTSSCPHMLRLMVLRFLLVPLVGLVLSGCVISRQRVVVNETPVPTARHITEYFPTSLYRLAAGDVLEILFLSVLGTTGTPYRCNPKTPSKLNSHSIRK